MIFLIALLSAWPVEWYQEYSLLNWGNMEQISSGYEYSAIDLAVKAISQFGSGGGDPVQTAKDAVALDGTDYRTWTALAFVGMEQDSVRMDSLFSMAFSLVEGIDPVLNEAYSYWLLSMGNSADAVSYSSAALEADSSFGPAWLTLSMALSDAGHINTALVVSEEAVWRFPNCISLSHQYAQLLEESGNTGKAIDAYREIVRQAPDRVSAFASLGLLLESTRHNGEAIKVYRDVLQIYPEYGWAWSRLALCLQKAHRPALADSFFQKALEFSPNDSLSLFQIARFRINTNPTYARELLEQTVQLYPDFSNAWQELAFLYESENDFVSAETALRRCIELEPEPMLYGELGWVLENREMYVDAVEAYETSILIDPQYLFGWQRRGDIYNTNGETHAAAEWYTDALLVLSKDDSWIWRELGIIAMAESLIDSAEHCFLAAMEIDPEYSYLWLDMARIQRLTGKIDDSHASLEQYLLLSGDSAVVAAEGILLHEIDGEHTDSLVMVMTEKWPDAWISAGWSAYNNGYPILAQKYADRALELSFELPWQLINLGELYGNLDFSEKQRQCYQIASEKETDDYNVAVRIADYYYGENLIREAIELLSKAYDSFVWNETLTTSLAEAYLFNDQVLKAEELLLQVVERNPSSVYAICYLGLIEENLGNPVEALDRYLEALRIESGYSYAENRIRHVSSENYDPAFQRRNSQFINWNAWIDLSSTSGNINEQHFGGGGNLSLSYGEQGSTLGVEVSTRSENRDGIEIYKSAWAALSAEHFLSSHLYAGASSNWDRQPLTVRPWQTSSYVAVGWKSWPASWVWIAPETGVGLVNTSWNTLQGRTDEITAYASLSLWASSSLSWLPSMWLSGSVYLPPTNADKFVADAAGELKLDLPGRFSVVLGSALDYTRSPVVESWEKLDSEVYLRLHF